MIYLCYSKDPQELKYAVDWQATHDDMWNCLPQDQRLKWVREMVENLKKYSTCPSQKLWASDYALCEFIQHFAGEGNLTIYCLDTNQECSSLAEMNENPSLDLMEELGKLKIKKALAPEDPNA